jgi:hypothetical protein
VQFNLSFSDLSPRPLHRRGSPCAIYGILFMCTALIPPSPVERGSGRGKDKKRQFEIHPKNKKYFVFKKKL